MSCLPPGPWSKRDDISRYRIYDSNGRPIAEILLGDHEDARKLAAFIAESWHRAFIKAASEAVK